MSLTVEWYLLVFLYVLYKKFWKCFVTRCLRNPDTRDSHPLIRFCFVTIENEWQVSVKGTMSYPSSSVSSRTTRTTQLLCVVSNPFDSFGRRHPVSWSFLLRCEFLSRSLDVSPGKFRNQLMIRHLGPHSEEFRSLSWRSLVIRYFYGSRVCLDPYQV